MKLLLLYALLVVRCQGWLSYTTTVHTKKLASTTRLRQSTSTMRAMEKAVVLIDPITDWKNVIEAAASLEYTVIAVQLPSESLPAKFRSFLPTPLALKEAGVDHLIPVEKRDAFSITQQIQILSSNSNLRVMGVVPLSEIAVEMSDCIAACLGLPHNALDRVTARRDKGIMKNAVESKGLRVAKFGRVASMQDVNDTMSRLSLQYPIVLKTPAGMSTTDVFISSSEEEASEAIELIIDNIGPDGRRVKMALLEEYIGGDEFAINLMVFPNLDCNKKPHVLVTDVWKYKKTIQARYSSAEICNPADYPALLEYATNVAEAVGIQIGAAHVELKAEKDPNGSYVNPVLIEVGARLSGGRKSIMAQSAVMDWNPFDALIQTHCLGTADQIMPRDTNFLIPKKFVRHLFLPIEKRGCVEKVDLDVSSLTTLHSFALIIKVGDIVDVTTDIVSCAGFVWLVGDRETVDKDTDAVSSSYVLSVKDV